MKKPVSGITSMAGLLAILDFSYLNAAPPSISSASVSNGAVQIAGSGFRDKAAAAPYKFQPFTATSQGQSYSQAGFDFVGGNNSGAARNYSDMADGVGGGSWMHVTPGGGTESFSHFGHLLPDRTDAVYASYWVRLRRLTDATGGRTGQFKAMRSGMRAGPDPVSEMYYVNPKFEFSCYIDVTNLSALTGPNAGSHNAADSIQQFYPENAYDVPLIGDTWQFCEIYYKLNTLGQANGIQQIRFNGTQHVDLHDRRPRTSASEYLGYIQYNPGLANDFMQSVWEVRFSRIYLDTTRARVFLGDAATLAGCRGRFLLAPTSWSDSSISAGHATNIPAGYSWAYVSNRDGEMNSHGFAVPEVTGVSRGADGRTISSSGGKAERLFNARGQVLGDPRTGVWRRESRVGALAR